MKEDLDHEIEYENFCKARGIWDNEKKCATRFVINKLKTITVTHPNGSKTLQNVHDCFTTKRPKQKICQYCFSELTGIHRKFCSTRCNDLYSKIKKKRIELKAVGIYWQKKENSLFPQWKDMTVVYEKKNGDFIIDNKGFTKKSGKEQNRNHEEFSTGKDY